MRGISKLVILSTLSLSPCLCLAQKQPTTMMEADEWCVRGSEAIGAVYGEFERAQAGNWSAEVTAKVTSQMLITKFPDREDWFELVQFVRVNWKYDKVTVVQGYVDNCERMYKERFGVQEI
jgi:hypothetical protein